ncbi:MAG: hypothetical protein M1269_02245 [Chloroflexi bacterium]|nr:hypothetical protein [Chloroflexota bacterium]
MRKMEDGSFKISFWRLWLIVWGGCILVVFATPYIFDFILPGMNSQELSTQRQIDVIEIWDWRIVIFSALAYISILWATLRYFRLRWLIGFGIGIFIGITIVFWPPFAAVFSILFYHIFLSIPLIYLNENTFMIFSNILNEGLFSFFPGFIVFLGISFILESKRKMKSSWIRLLFIGAIGGVLFLLIQMLDIYIFSKEHATSSTLFLYPLICGFFTSLIGSIHPYIDYARKWNKEHK